MTTERIYLTLDGQSHEIIFMFSSNIERTIFKDCCVTKIVFLWHAKNVPKMKKKTFSTLMFTLHNKQHLPPRGL